MHIIQTIDILLYCYTSSNGMLKIFLILSRYVEEKVQRTGVAIETQGFSVVTSGRKRESLTVSMQKNQNLNRCSTDH